MQRLRTTAFRRPKFQHKGQRSRTCLATEAHSCPPPQTVRMASPDKRSVGGSTELFFLCRSTIGYYLFQPSSLFENHRVRHASRNLTSKENAISPNGLRASPARFNPPVLKTTIGLTNSMDTLSCSVSVRQPVINSAAICDAGRLTGVINHADGVPEKISQGPCPRS